MSRRAWAWVLGLAAAVAGLAWVLAVAIDEPLGRRLEQRMNQQLTRYTVTIGGLDLPGLEQDRAAARR
jgi:uncharacterized protein YdgA (DUF945 family)